MSRRAHVVRTDTQPRGPSQSRLPDEPFTWNASIQNVVATTIDPGAETVLDGTRHHASLGDDDFDEDGTIVKVRIPRDGIYSVSTIVSVVSTGTPGAYATITLAGGSAYGYLGSDQRPVTENPFDPGGPQTAVLQAGNAGYPFTAGETVWATGSHGDATAMSFSLLELAVTYEAKLGTVYQPGGGG